MSRIFKEKNMDKIQIELENCLKCPFCKSRPTVTSDNFEVAFDYYCGKNNDKSIMEYVERNWEMPKIPNWCPIKV